MSRGTIPGCFTASSLIEQAPGRRFRGCQLLLFSQTSVSCADDGLCPVDHLQLVEDVGDMVTYRLRAQDQASRGLPVAAVLCNQGQDFTFAVGEFGEDLTLSGGQVTVAEMLSICSRT